ncbi:MAG TPA: hypothetical protein DCX53_06335, partial [Anaerolineae bacterium]|nr:hypothetical protein [Anaerolineae bacterium]
EQAGSAADEHDRERQPGPRDERCEQAPAAQVVDGQQRGHGEDPQIGTPGGETEAASQVDRAQGALGREADHGGHGRTRDTPPGLEERDVEREYLGAMPAKYYTQGNFPAVDNISGAMMTEQILVGRSACQGCVIACGRVVKLPKDALRRKGPEHETMVGFGANLLNDNLESIVDLGELCDHYGMDTISTSNTIGLAFHLYEKGVITKEDTDGVELKWGDVDAVEELVHLIGKREGIGNLLAQGSKRFAAHFGVEEEAVQVNGLEVAYHDPRGVSGMALSYATSPRGACHNNSDYFFVDFGHSHEELGIEFMSRHAQAEKAASVAKHQDWRTIDNAVVMCIFANVEAKEKAALINAACGLDWTVDDMMKFGERSWNLKRAINNRMGLTRDNDKLPKALLTPYPDGGTNGFVPDIEAMLLAYYRARGWDIDTGKPSREKLSELGLEAVADDLWK